METENPKVVQLRNELHSLGDKAAVDYFQTLGPCRPLEVTQPKGPFQFGQITYYAEVVSVDSHKEITVRVGNSRYFKPGDKIVINQNVGE